MPAWLANEPERFSTLLVAWQAQGGRHDLPWQNTRNPYRVWLSEIMLQQTQVTTVLGYYERFLNKFPTVTDLAAAQSDDVLALWSGLGYYSRARNLHRCAQQVVSLHDSEFPKTAEMLQTLPGIGPSTAAAIASFCYAERVAILDGNVKRVLTRLLAFDGDLAQSKQEKQLLNLANRVLPLTELDQTMPRYTQGVMDLGATLCTLRKPQCGACPVQILCQGFAQQQPERFPIKTRKLKRSSQQLFVLLAQQPDGSVWLERRADSGIWGGLYSLPVFETEAQLMTALPTELQSDVKLLDEFKHVLTHKDLYLKPFKTAWHTGLAATLKIDSEISGWYRPDEWPQLGLPTPMRKLLSGETQHA